MIPYPARYRSRFRNFANSSIGISRKSSPKFLKIAGFNHLCQLIGPFSLGQLKRFAAVPDCRIAEAKSRVPPMRKILLSLIFLLAVFAHAAAQTQTAEPKATAAQSANASRSRVVGPKAENHAGRPQANPRQLAVSSPGLIQKTALVTPSPAASSKSGPPRANLPSVSLPAPPTATSAIYRVGVGDVLDIRLAKMPTRESTLFTVMRNGTIEFPLLNYPLTVSGITTDEISRLLRQEIKVISDARATVSVRDYASHEVLVTGVVDSPGKKFMRRESMPLYAVIAEALPRPEGSVATITRGGRAESFSMTDSRAMATLVLPGDVIKISGAVAAPKRFLYVGGDVASPGEREFRDGMTLTQALLAAGGVPGGAKSIVKVSRRNAGGFLVVREYNLRMIEEGKSPDPLIEAGDRIEVTRSM